MKDVTNYKSINKLLLKWFNINKRLLPWRVDRSPYKTWLSEIILQQTRVEQGLPYYERFIKAFPNIQLLANAQEQEILKLWQGLGYYSRARNLHFTAKLLVEKHLGIFPSSFEELIKLKGIGNYTAAAILSINFDKPYAVLDGNVYRVLSRVFNESMPINEKGAEKYYQHLADKLLDKKSPGDFNEAMMELGASICIPKKPQCEVCPINKFCLAYVMGTQQELPKKINKNIISNRTINYLFIHSDKGLFLKFRAERDIWKGLYDFPEIIDDKTGKNSMANNQFSNFPIISSINHKLTHRNLIINFHEISINTAKSKNILKVLNLENIEFIDFKNLKEYPLPKPIEIFLEEYLHNTKM